MVTEQFKLSKLFLEDYLNKEYKKHRNKQTIFRKQEKKHERSHMLAYSMDGLITSPHIVTEALDREWMWTTQRPACMPARIYELRGPGEPALVFRVLGKQGCKRGTRQDRF